jgi:DNA adenine methylase
MGRIGRRSCDPQPFHTTGQTAPFLRWAGSKRKLLSRLAAYWRPTYRRYVEPFAGCAALFFRIQPKQAVLADLNADLMEVYEQMRDSPERLHRAVSRIPSGEKDYYRIRGQDSTRLSKLRRAVRFVYLNRYCFNGIYRTNLTGAFNVPFGAHKSGSIPSVEHFRCCAELLATTTLRACDFGFVLRDTREGDFVYIDPPYAVESRRVFREFGPREFTKADLQRLADHLHQMHNRGVHFLVSYADCAESRRILKRWSPTRIRVKRHVAGFTGSRRTAYELLATNINRKGRERGRL